MLYVFPITMNLFQNTLIHFFFVFPTPTSFIHDNFIPSLHDKTYRLIRNFLHIIIKQNRLIGLKGLPNGIPNTAIFYAMY